MSVGVLKIGVTSTWIGTFILSSFALQTSSAMRSKDDSTPPPVVLRTSKIDEKCPRHAILNDFDPTPYTDVLKETEMGRNPAIMEMLDSLDPVKRAVVLKNIKFVWYHPPYTYHPASSKPKNPRPEFHERRLEILKGLLHLPAEQLEILLSPQAHFFSEWPEKKELNPEKPLASYYAPLSPRYLRVLAFYSSFFAKCYESEMRANMLSDFASWSIADINKLFIHPLTAVPQGAILRRTDIEPREVTYSPDGVLKRKTCNQPGEISYSIDRVDGADLYDPLYALLFFSEEKTDSLRNTLLNHGGYLFRKLAGDRHRILDDSYSGINTEQSEAVLRYLAPLLPDPINGYELAKLIPLFGDWKANDIKKFCRDVYEHRNSLFENNDRRDTITISVSYEYVVKNKNVLKGLWENMKHIPPVSPLLNREKWLEKKEKRDQAEWEKWVSERDFTSQNGPSLLIKALDLPPLQTDRLAEFDGADRMEMLHTLLRYRIRNIKEVADGLALYSPFFFDATMTHYDREQVRHQLAGLPVTDMKTLATHPLLSTTEKRLLLNEVNLRVTAENDPRIAYDYKFIF